MGNSQKQTTGSKVLQAILAVIFGFMISAVLFFIYKVWPVDPSGKEFTCSLYCIRDIKINQEQQYLLLVILGGFLGAMVQVIISYSAFVGTKSFVRSWIPWYFLRPLTGASFALIFYLLLRGGLLSVNTTTAANNDSNVQSNISLSHTDSMNVAQNVAGTVSALLSSKKISSKDSTTVSDSLFKKGLSKAIEDLKAKGHTQQPIPLNPFGLMSIACLAGLFSKYASEKLEEVFKTIFSVKQENKVVYSDKLPGSKEAVNSDGTDSKTDKDEPDDINDVLPDANIDDDNNEPKG